MTAFDDELSLRQRVLRAERALARLRAALVSEHAPEPVSKGDPDAEAVALAARVRALAAVVAEGEAALEAARRECAATASALAEAGEALAREAVRAAALEGSVRFRLGSLLVDLLRSPRAWARLPGRAVRLLRRRPAALAGDAVGGAPPTIVAPPIDGLWPPPKVIVPPPAEASELVGLPGPPALPASQRGLRVAVILDPFSHASFAPECELVALHPGRWHEQLREAPPHLLLVESAWTGLDGEWTGGIERAPAMLRAIVASCRQAGIPTVFWNKEDPLHFEAFLPAARLFDHVFTTDADSVPRYRRDLGHSRVGLLPFALQPRTQHPLTEGRRETSSVFAGAWYGNLPERCEDFERVADALALAGPLVIHDRHSGVAAPHQRFPAKYAASLRPSVPYEETPALFRRHRIGINLNTIKQSPTMFARRVLELVGCNTSVYGNHSLALRRLFGDLTVASDDPAQLLKEVWHELRDPDAPRFRQRRLRALRKVLREHTWTRRLTSMAAAVFGPAAPVAGEGAILVLARVPDAAALGRVTAAFAAQRGVQATLLLDLADGLDAPPGIVRLDEHAADPEDWLAVFHPDDHYGAHYLEDLALARAFAPVLAVGKAAWFEPGPDGAPVLQHPAREYARVPSLALRRSLVKRSAWAGSLADMLDDAATGEMVGDGLLSVDALHYCAGGAACGLPAFDGHALDDGVGLDEMEALVARLPPAPDAGRDDADALDGAQLAHLFNLGVVPAGTSASVRDGRLEVCSLLPRGCEDALFTAPIARDVLERAGCVRVTLQAPPASQLDLFLDAIDGTGTVLRRVPLPRGVAGELEPPTGTAAYRLAARVEGRFVHSIDGLWLGHYAAQPLLLPGAGRLLLVCPGYPEADRLYRYAFVHRRVLAYRARGIRVDVVWVSAHETPRSYEFEGVSVQICDPSTLAATLRVSAHAAVAVHAPDALLWQAVGEAAGVRPVVAWLHGAEIQPWSRRPFNIPDGDEAARREAIAASDARMAFWRALLAAPPPGLHVVFVSRQFAKETWEDLGLRLSEERWSVIPNPIDTALFASVPKGPEQRFSILSIRPHASRVYANDLVAAAIRVLADHPMFSRLRFTLVGDGPRWEEDFAGLDAYPNVRLHRRFLTQSAIADLHRTHGVFLVPTRADTQGVSRDEAMASGLVPVTCAVGSVPEFVDEASGLLCPPDNPQALADAIIRLVEEPDLFVRLSKGAAERVRRDRGLDTIIDRECALLTRSGVVLPSDPSAFSSTCSQG